jgi:hypothetical protein
MLEVVHTRIDFIFSDITAYSNGNKDTSIGVRFQLYLAAIHLFIEHPFFGVGPGGFPQAMSALTASGMVTPLGGLLGTSEVHNEILHKCAETGIFGLTSILSVYLVPSIIFWQARKSPASSIRIASFMGICLVVGFFMFGLTVEIFDLKMTATFFAFTLAVLIAAATHQAAPETVTTLKNSGANFLAKESLNTVVSHPASLIGISHVFYYAKISFAPSVAILALATTAMSINKNQLSQAQLGKANIQIENLSTNLLTTQDELKKLQSEITQRNAMWDESQKKQDEQISILIQNINALQIKMKISPTLEVQLRQLSSTVTPVANN